MGIWAGFDLERMLEEVIGGGFVDVIYSIR